MSQPLGQHLMRKRLEEYTPESNGQTASAASMSRAMLAGLSVGA